MTVGYAFAATKNTDVGEKHFLCTRKTFNQWLTVSVGVSKSVYTDLIFVNSRVESLELIIKTCFCYTFLPTIRQPLCRVHRSRNSVNFGGGKTFLPENYMWKKINKMPKFYIIFPRNFFRKFWEQMLPFTPVSYAYVNNNNNNNNNIQIYRQSDSIAARGGNIITTSQLKQPAATMDSHTV